MTTHIVAMGGGGFSSSEGYAATALDRYILSLTTKPNPLVCFVPSAAGDNGLYIQRFTNAYTRSGVTMRTAILTLWEGVAESIDRMDEVDVFMIGGGSTVNLLALWNVHGINRKFIDMCNDPDRDVVIAGLAAGASVFHEASTTGSYGRGVQPYPHGLGILPGSFSPHFDRYPDRADVFKAYVDDGVLPEGYGADIGAAIHYIDGEIEAFITEKDGAQVYWCEQAERGAKLVPQEMTKI
jgi:dipeptidase E